MSAPEKKMPLLGRELDQGKRIEEQLLERQEQRLIDWQESRFQAAWERTRHRGRVAGRQKRQPPHKSENPHDGKSADSQKFSRNRTGSEATNGV